MRISLSDPRLSHGERRFLRGVAEKLRQPPRPQLPEGYSGRSKEAFGSCGEGETDRWQHRGSS